MARLTQNGWTRLNSGRSTSSDATLGLSATRASQRSSLSLTVHHAPVLLLSCAAIPANFLLFVQQGLYGWQDRELVVN